MFTTKSNQIFSQAIADYHRFDKVDMPIDNPYKNGSIEYLLYLKNWIDTVQWHLEDIDRSNQERTDMVEYIDSYFLDLYKDVPVAENATVNTESPAWAIDRLSILALKIYHMAQEVARKDVSLQHVEECGRKLAVLRQQQDDLSAAIDQLLEDIAAGRKYMKVYKQMKMYNDPELNPVLYASK